LRIRAALSAFGGAVKRPPLVFGAVVEPPFVFPGEPVSLAELGGVVVALVVSEAAFGPGAAFWLEAAASLVLDSELPLLAEGLFAGADGGCGATGGFCGTFAGIAAVASRRAAKGCGALAWLALDACARCKAAKEGVALTSDAILGTAGPRPSR
jgi:hypothetical protein